MDNEQSRPPLTEFNFGQGPEGVIFEETVSVVEGVECDVYCVKDDISKDLGIIRIALGHKTPLQRVLKGEKTVEGHVSGEGVLVITRTDGNEEIYPVSEDVNQHFSIDVGIGEKMQWQASENSHLEAFEICIPPYEEGRYEDIE